MTRLINSRETNGNPKDKDKESARLSLFLCASRFAYMAIYLPTRLSPCLSLRLHGYIYLPTRLSPCLSVSLPVCLSVCLSCRFARCRGLCTHQQRISTSLSQRSGDVPLRIRRRRQQAFWDTRCDVTPFPTSSSRAEGRR